MYEYLTTLMSGHPRRDGRNRTASEGNHFGASGCMAFEWKGILRFEAVTGIYTEFVTCKGKTF
jgi:hypothetical protein